MDSRHYYSEIRAVRDSVEAFSDCVRRNREVMRDVEAFVGRMLSLEKDIKSFEALVADMDRRLAACDSGSFRELGIVESACCEARELKSGLAALKRLGKSLKDCPDRYGASASLSKADALLRFCAKTMDLSQVGQARKDVARCMDELASVQGGFEAEARMRKEISRIVADNASLLSAYPVFSAELDRFADAFPHEADKDLEAVREWLGCLAKADAALSTVRGLCSAMDALPDRYGLRSLLGEARGLLDFAHGGMGLANVAAVCRDASALAEGLESSRASFECDEVLLRRVRALVSSRQPLLQRFPAVLRGMEAYLRAFPNGDDDYGVVESWLDRLEVLDRELSKALALADTLDGLPDRHDAGVVRKRIRKDIDSCFSVRIDEMEKGLRILDGIYPVAASLKADFERERASIAKAYASFEQECSGTVWQEDYDAMEKRWKLLMSDVSDGEDMERIAEYGREAKQRKQSDIERIRKDNRWVEFHLDDFIWSSQRRLTKGEFLGEVKRMKDGRSLSDKVYEYFYFIVKDLKARAEKHREQSVRYCKNCGHRTGSGDSFCKHCGTRIY